MSAASYFAVIDRRRFTLRPTPSSELNVTRHRIAQSGQVKGLSTLRCRNDFS